MIRRNKEPFYTAKTVRRMKTQPLSRIAAFGCVNGRVNGCCLRVFMTGIVGGVLHAVNHGLHCGGLACLTRTVLMARLDATVFG